LLDKAQKHYTTVHETNTAVIQEMDQIDFVGMSEDEIDEERKEYAISHSCDFGVTDVRSVANGVTLP
jgi:hypothetical protein